MTILGLETSTKVCSVALGINGKLISLKETDDSNFSHAENLTVFIEEVCKQATISLKEIDAVAISKGPGSFTGLRIGVSAAKGLCYALDKPLIAINSLEAMALNVKLQTEENKKQNHFFYPMLDARRMEVYAALYDSNLKELIPTSAIIIDKNTSTTFSSSYLEKNDSVIYFFGEGADKCKPFFTHPGFSFIENITASAQYLLPIAESHYSKNKFENLAYFEPFYLKDFVGMKKEG